MLSIVMTYLNRRPQLINTLRSIQYFNNNIEIILVDDSSEQSIDDIPGLFWDLNITLLNTNRQTHDPVIPFNLGFKNLSGDKVLITCAECLHMGDIIGYCLNNLSGNKYFNFATYAIAEEKTKQIEQKNTIEDVLSMIVPRHPLDLNNIQGSPEGWYVHSRARNNLLPFCAAMTVDCLLALGGFDERFCDGIGYADDDFTDRVKNLGMQTFIIDDPFCIHQAHIPTYYEPERTEKNKQLLEKLRKEQPNRIHA